MTHPPTVRPTSILLLALVLLTGVAIGWALNDLIAPPAAPAAPTAPPTAPPASTPLPPPTPLPPTAAPPAPTLAPTAEATLPSPTAAPPAATAIPAPPAPTAPPATPEAQPSPAAVSGYVGHVVAEGETLAEIAANGGSSPEAVAAYNRLPGEPQPGRALIVPRLAGQTSVLEDVPIMVQRGSGDRPLVALTLDAGAGAAPTPRMLTALRERGVRITFFLTGTWIAENPELTRQIVADGHELANHTYSHPDLRRVDDAEIRAELAQTEAALAEAAPGASLRPFFRPPYGAYDDRVIRAVQAEGYLPVYWTLDSLDSVGEPKTPEFLLERVTAKLTPEQLRGAIILAHCGSEPTADALPAILDRFAEMGFQVVPLSEALAGAPNT